jgi:hypothetical protein
MILIQYHLAYFEDIFPCILISFGELFSKSLGIEYMVFDVNYKIADDQL